MKAVIVLLATVISFSAQARLESHYGVLKQRGLSWNCSLKNKKNRTMDLKYVVFTLAPSSGDSSDYRIQERVDIRLQPGETARASTNTSIHSYSGTCHFLER
ncbi:hypothetical protein D3C87_1162830 [compost metagenome]